LFELTSHTRLVHVPRLGQDVDLRQISVEQAEQLLALPGGFEWLRRKAPPVAAEVEVPLNDAGPVEETTDPARAKKKSA
jgi:hypothetical protein